jgi:hypothetical protein
MTYGENEYVGHLLFDEIHFCLTVCQVLQSHIGKPAEEFKVPDSKFKVQVGLMPREMAAFQPAVNLEPSENFEPGTRNLELNPLTRSATLICRKNFRLIPPALRGPARA